MDALPSGVSHCGTQSLMGGGLSEALCGILVCRLPLAGLRAVLLWSCTASWGRLEPGTRGCVRWPRKGERRLEAPSVDPSPFREEVCRPHSSQELGGPVHSWPLLACCWVPVLPQEPVSQQPANPRELFRQKERSMSTTSISSAQPGETSLWVWP